MRIMLAAASLAAIVVSLGGCASSGTSKAEVVDASGKSATADIRPMFTPKYKLAIGFSQQFDVQFTDPVNKVPVTWQGAPSVNAGSLWTHGSGSNSVFETKGEDDTYGWRVVMDPVVEGEAQGVAFDFTLEPQRADKTEPYVSSPPPDGSPRWETLQESKFRINGQSTAPLIFSGSNPIPMDSWVRYTVSVQITGTPAYDCGGPCVRIASGNLSFQGAVDQ